VLPYAAPNPPQPRFTAGAAFLFEGSHCGLVFETSTTLCLAKVPSRYDMLVATITSTQDVDQAVAELKQTLDELEAEIIEIETGMNAAQWAAYLKAHGL
jgi:hypothetical protein